MVERTICVICAWRENCQKKYTFETSGQSRCPDYTRDLALKPDETKEVTKKDKAS